MNDILALAGDLAGHERSSGETKAGGASGAALSPESDKWVLCNVRRRVAWLFDGGISGLIEVIEEPLDISPCALPSCTNWQWKFQLKVSEAINSPQHTCLHTHGFSDTKSCGRASLRNERNVIHLLLLTLLSQAVVRGVVGAIKVRVALSRTGGRSVYKSERARGRRGRRLSGIPGGGETTSQQKACHRFFNQKEASLPLTAIGEQPRP